MTRYDELLKQAQVIHDVVHNCDIHAKPGTERCPWETIGIMRSRSREMLRQVNQLIADEERAEQSRREHREMIRQLSEQKRRRSPEREYGVPARGEIP
jgi:hypothetical protein